MSIIQQRFIKASAVTMGLLLIALVLLECVQVILRYLFSIGLFWASDVTSLLLLSLGWLGAAHLWITRLHIEIDLFVNNNFIPLWIVRAIGDAATIVGVLWLLPQFSTAIDIFSSIILPALNLSMAAKYIPPLVGVCLIGLFASINLIDDLLRLSRQNNR